MDSFKFKSTQPNQIQSEPNPTTHGIDHDRKTKFLGQHSNWHNIDNELHKIETVFCRSAIEVFDEKGYLHWPSSKG